MAKGRRVHKKKAGAQAWPIYGWWRQALAGWLDQEGHSQAKLAKTIGCDCSLLSLIITGETGVSALVEPICKATGLPLPTFANDPEMATLVDAAERARRHDPAALARITRDAKELADMLDKVGKPKGD